MLCFLLSERSVDDLSELHSDRECFHLRNEYHPLWVFKCLSVLLMSYYKNSSVSESSNNGTLGTIQIQALFLILFQHSKLQMLSLQSWQVNSCLKDLENSQDSCVCRNWSNMITLESNQWIGAKEKAQERESHGHFFLQK